MSRERARRRSEREAAEAQRREQERRRAGRPWGGTGPLRRLAAAVPGVGAGGRAGGRAGGARGAVPTRPSSPLRRQRARQDGVLLAVLLCLHAVLWLLQPSWWWRGGALVATALLWPLLVVLAFDRRPSR